MAALGAVQRVFARSPDWHVSVLAIVVVPIAAGFVCYYGDQPLRDQPHQLITINAALAFGFALSAMLLTRTPNQRFTAFLFGCATITFTVGWFRFAEPDPLPYLQSSVLPLYWVFLGWAVLRYPLPRLQRRSQRIFVATAFGWLGIGHAALAVLYDPARDTSRWGRDVWWPTFYYSKGLWSVISGAEIFLDGVVAVWYVVLAGRKLRRASGMDEWILTPLRSSIIAAAVPLAIRPIAVFFGDDAKKAVNVVVQIALLLIPIAVVTALIRARLLRGAVADLVGRLTHVETAAGVTSALQLALRDPRLVVAFSVPASEDFVDPDGVPILAKDLTGLLSVPLLEPDGTSYGRVFTDARLELHRDVVEAAVSTGALALQNARLLAALQVQLDQVRASQRRLAEVAVAERRRLERDLHDGVQQRLLALNLRLSDMRARGEDTAAVVARTRAELHACLTDLRDLAHGIHPAALDEGGLTTALDEVLDRLAFPVDLHVDGGRFPAIIESTAYYVVCESLSNVLKHARATRAGVDVRAVGACIEVRITDDGEGGATMSSGSGVKGLADRVRAVGGEFAVTSSRTEGTTIFARLPCA